MNPPIPMVLVCPKCARQHVDIDDWATRPHRKHLCAACGHEWQPANVDTVGVAMLPPDRRMRIRRVVRLALDKFAETRKIRVVPEVHDELAAEIEKDLRLLLEAPTS